MGTEVNAHSFQQDITQVQGKLTATYSSESLQQLLFTNTPHCSSTDKI